MSKNASYLPDGEVSTRGIVRLGGLKGAVLFKDYLRILGINVPFDDDDELAFGQRSPLRQPRSGRRTSQIPRVLRGICDDAPGLVANGTAAVLTRGLGTVTVAVEENRAIKTPVLFRGQGRRVVRFRGTLGWLERPEWAMDKIVLDPHDNSERRHIPSA